MAFMSQERKAKIADRVKPILKKYGLKGTLSVRHHSTIVLTIQSGSIDFIESYNRLLEAKAYGRPVAKAEKNLDINHHWYRDHFDGQALDFLNEVMPALNLEGDVDANFDKSEIQTDYFHVGWYVDVCVGRWNKPYQLAA